MAMRALRRLLGKVRSLFGSREENSDFEAEIADHLKLLTVQYIRQGISPEEANQAARRQFGNTTLLREDRRALQTIAIIDAFGRDLRYACRMLRKRPAFIVAAVLTLGLVIGANGAIFSVLQAVLLRPLPFFKPGQLVLLFCKDESAARNSISPVDLEDWSRARSFQSVSALQGQSVNLTGVEEPARVIGSFVSSTFFPMLGIHPVRGRFFTKVEDQPGTARVCVVSFGLWQGQFGGDPHLVGRSLILNGELYTVVGILPESFRAPFLASDVWLPIWTYPNYVRDRRENNVLGIARLSDGVGLQQARAELATITKQLAIQYPDTNRSRSAVILPLHDTVVEDLRPILLLLAGAVACVLLIGCANVAALQLTQAFGRRQELAVRASLGAGKGRLMGQLLIESSVLGLVGGLCGLGIAAGGIRLIAAYSNNITADMPIGLNTPVLLFLLLVSLSTGVLFGLAPAWMARKEAVNFLRVRGAQRVHGTMRGMLVTVQVALALVLLASAGLLLKSLQKLVSVDPGFKTDHLLTLEYRVPRNKYPKGAQQTRFHEQVVSKVAALPGVESAADIRALPFSGNSASRIISFPDRAPAPAGTPWIVGYNAVSPEYFSTVRMPLLEGRFFTPADESHSPRAVIVSRSFEAKFWPQQKAVGRQVLVPRADSDSTTAADLVPATVVGVVPGTKHDSLTEPEAPQLYVPYAQDPFIFTTLVVRTKGDPMARARDVQRAVWSVDRDQSVWKIRTMESLIVRSVQNRRYVIFLLGCFSTLALVLAAVGLYGVLAYSVTQRTAEFGIRLAIGAEPGQILSSVVKNGLRLTLIGLTIGCGVALLSTRFLRAQLYEVSGSDPAVYAAICALLLCVGLLAAVLPACRASRVDPVIALRQE
jgi:putative ABC transport system permease protein